MIVLISQKFATLRGQVVFQTMNRIGGATENIGAENENPGSRRRRNHS